MGILAGLKGAQPSTKDPFFLVGTYKVQLVNVKIHTSQKDSSVSFIINGKIVESDNGARPVGMVCSQVIKVTGNPSALGNVKAFLAACMELDTNDPVAMEQIDESLVENIIKEGTLQGLVMRLVCTNTKTAKGSDFTIHNWSLVKDA